VSATRQNVEGRPTKIETPIPGAMRRGGMAGSEFYAQTGGGGCLRARTTGECGSRSPLSENRVNPQRGGPTSLGWGRRSGLRSAVVSWGYKRACVSRLGRSPSPAQTPLCLSRPLSPLAKRAVPAPSAGYQGAETMRAGPSDGGIARTVSLAKSGRRAKKNSSDLALGWAEIGAYAPRTLACEPERRLTLNIN
jgi:hypothetical protein